LTINLKMMIKQKLETIIEAVGPFNMGKKKDEKQKNTLNHYEQYQAFFNNPKEEFIKLPHLLDTLKKVLADTFQLSEQQLKKIISSPQINKHPQAKEKFYQKVQWQLYRLLESPKTGAFKIL